MDEKAQENGHLSREESAMYDRQIRLWGAEAQRRISAAKIFLGGMQGLMAEIAKNIVLAGVGRVILNDNTLVQIEDLSSNFLVTEGDIGTPRSRASEARLRELNGFVDVTVEDEEVQNFKADYWQQFDLVCVCDMELKDLIPLNDVLRAVGVKLIAAFSFGQTIASFTDLVSHEYLEEVKKAVGSGDDATTKSRRHESFLALRDALVEPFRNSELRKTESGAVLGAGGSSSQPTLATLWFESRELRKATAEDISYISFSPLIPERARRNWDAAELLRLINARGMHYNPSCAAAACIISQEILKAVSHKDAPLPNFFVFDGLTTSGRVMHLGIRNERQSE